MPPAKKRKKPGPIARLKALRDRTDEDKARMEQERLDRLKQENRRFLLFVFTAIRHVRAFLKKNAEDNVSALSGQSAFFLILSIIPILLFVLSIISLFGGEPDESALQAAQGSLGGSATKIVQSSGITVLIRKIVSDAIQTVSSGTVIITAIAALWSAGKGLYIITDGISRIYQLPRKHIWFFRRVFAMGYTVVLLLMMALCIGLLILNATVDDYISRAVDGLPGITGTLYALRYVIATVIMALFMTLALKLYLHGKLDDKRYTKFRVLLPGMLLTAIAWDVLTWGVNFYSTHFTNSVYGSLGAVFILMMWIYFMMLLLLYGVQFNYIYRERFCNFSLKRAFSALKNRKRKKKRAH